MREEWELLPITIYKSNAAMCSIVYLCKFVRDFILISNRGVVNRRSLNSNI